MMTGIVSLLLLLAGVGAIAAAVLVDTLTGQPLTIGWSQLFLILAGAMALVVAPAPVRRRLARALAESRRQSPGFIERLSPWWFVIYGGWLGLVFSIVEAALASYEAASGKKVYGLQYFYIAPVMFVVPAVIVGVGCALAARTNRRPLWLAVCVFVPSLVAVAGWLAVVGGGLHVAAVAVLAAGLALQAGRFSAAHAWLFHRVVRRTLAPVAVLVGAAALTAGLAPIVRESRARAALPPPPASAPNVLLLVLDTVSARSLSLYGYARHTAPNLERLARRGATFSRAFATAPWTLPSHGSMFTGRFPHELTADWMTPIDGTHPTLAEALGQRGYATAGFIANTTYCSAEFGLGRGFAHYEDHLSSAVSFLTRTSYGRLLLDKLGLKTLVSSESEKVPLKSARRLNDDFLAWLDRRDRTRPYFAFLNYYDAHAPYLSPDEFGRKFRSTRPNGDIWAQTLDTWGAADIAEFRDAYDSAIAYLDVQVGKLVDALEARGDLDRTVVIVTSDHGEQFGEHGLLEHANSLYTELLHIPLVIAFPGSLPANARVDRPVSLVNLAATVLDLTGTPNDLGLGGRSLRADWAASAAGPADALLAEVAQAYPAYPATYPARRGRMKSLFADGMHYIRNFGDGREELFDLTSDLGETRDLAAERPDLLGAYRTRLDQFGR